MELTSHQQRAYAFIRERLADGAQVTCLTGFAGTGKTTLIGRLIDSLLDEGTKVFATTPTHKSAQVLRQTIENRAVIPQTIHSFLGLQLKPDGSGSYTVQRDERVKLPETGIVLVDEASMIGHSLWVHIQAAQNLQWVFVGDPAQLPPVNEEPSPALTVHGTSLEAVIRQVADNPIIRMATAIREGRPYLEESGFDGEHGVATTSSTHSFIDSIARAYAEGETNDGPPEVRVLAYRNAVVRRYNTLIRTLLHKGAANGRFVAGDWLMMIETYFQSGYPLVHNSEELCVENARVGDLATIGGLWRTHTIEGRIGNKLVTLPILHEEEQARFDAMLSSLRRKASTGKGKWADYYALREAFARLDYAYSLTIHKSQGSTFETVYLDHQDAVRSSPRERRRLLYVAVTRPRRRLALLV